MATSTMRCVVVRSALQTLPESLGPETLWTSSRAWTDGRIEYRRDPALGGELVFVLSPIAGAVDDWLVALWYKSESADSGEAAYVAAMLSAAQGAGVVSEIHDVAADWTVPTCDAHPLWPTSWRLRVAGDGPAWIGTPPDGEPGLPPSGGALLASVIA